MEKALRKFALKKIFGKIKKSGKGNHKTKYSWFFNKYITNLLLLGYNSNKGVVNIYEWDGSTYNNLDDPINGESNGDLFGGFVSLSDDGKAFAVGAIQNDGTGNNAGHVRVYKINTSSSTIVVGGVVS